MSTQEQTNANRKNAEKSTGPKTPEGKATSSQNAVKHGFFAKNDVISGEDLAFYEAHRQDIYDEYAPMTPSEAVLTQRIASLTWRLMRADRLQTTTINTLVAAQQRATQPKAPRELNINAMVAELRKKDKDPEYALNTAGIILAGLVRRQDTGTVTTDPTLDAAMSNAFNPPGSTRICEAEIQLGTVIYNDFIGPRVIERLQGYEQKIETSLFRTIRMFDQLQERRLKQEAPDWKRFRAEDQAARERREAEHHRRINERCNSDSPDDDEPENRNEPNSPLISISEMTYNRSHHAKSGRPNPYHLDSPNPARKSHPPPQ